MASNDMQRVTLRIPKGNVDTLDEIVDAGVYPNRSEAVRAGIVEVIKQHGGERVRPVRTDGAGLSREPAERDAETESERRHRRRERYGTINPALKLLTSDALERELPALLSASMADGVRATSADGGADTVTVEVTYHLEGRLGAGVFGLDRSDSAEDVRVVEFAEGYAALEPGSTVRDLFARTLCPGGFPATLEDALTTIAVVPASAYDDERPPSPDDYVGFDLEGVTDGDRLVTHLAPASEQPVYPEGFGARGEDDE